MSDIFTFVAKYVYSKVFHYSCLIALSYVCEKLYCIKYISILYSSIKACLFYNASFIVRTTLALDMFCETDAAKSVFFIILNS